MQADPLDQALIQAETRIVRSLQQASAMRRAALYGNYDTEGLLQALEAYQAANAEAKVLRQQMKDRAAAQSAQATSEKEEFERISRTFTQAIA